MFEELYEELPSLEQFMGAMTGFSRINFEAFRGGLQRGVPSPQQQQDIPRVIEIGKKYGLEIPPPSGA